MQYAICDTTKYIKSGVLFFVGMIDLLVLLYDPFFASIARTDINEPRFCMVWYGFFVFLGSWSTNHIVQQFEPIPPSGMILIRPNLVTFRWGLHCVPCTYWLCSWFSKYSTPSAMAFYFNLTTVSACGGPGWCMIAALLFAPKMARSQFLWSLLLLFQLPLRPRAVFTIFLGLSYY